MLLEARTRDLAVIRRFAAAMIRASDDVPPVLRELATEAMAAWGRIEEAQVAAEQQQSDALDPLSGLLNRRTLLRRMQEALDTSAVALLYLDLDQFGMVNDTLGYQVGDLLLQQVGRRIAGAIHEGDLAGRNSADQFVVVTSPDDADTMARRLRDVITAPFEVNELRELQMKVSIGIAIGEHRRAEELLNDADLALTEVKRTRPGDTRLFDQSLADRVRNRWKITVALARVLDSSPNDIDVFFQPIYALPSGTLAGAESLARWTDPVMGPVSPGDFVPAAETSGLIAPLEQHLLRRTLTYLKTLTSLHGLTFNVNVSAILLGTPGFSDWVLNLVDEIGLPHTALAVEVTETAVASDDGHARANLEALAAAGFGVVLDDFGTGYASLSSLTGYPFTGLKIDQQFTRGIGTRDKDAVIVRAVVSMAHAMALTVTAEGVETDEQLMVLRALGCEKAQGYALGRPMPFDKFRALIA